MRSRADASGDARLAPLAVFPSLTGALARAEKAAPGMVRARADLRAGKAAYVGARLTSLRNPYLEVFTDMPAREVLGDSTVLTANLWLPVEISGQRRRRIAEADALMAWRATSLAAARAQSAGSTVESYGNVAVAAERIQVLEGLVEVARTQAEALEARLDAGDATEQDVALARVDLAKNQVELAESRAELARALTELAVLIAAPSIPPPDSPPMPPNLGPAPPPAELSQEAETSPMVTAAEREALYHARVAARASRDIQEPVSLILTAGRGGMGEARVGAGVAWTFPVIWRGQGERAVAEAERDRALTEAELKVRLLETSLAGLHLERVRVREAREQLDAAAMPAALGSVEAANQTFQAGKGDVLTVLTARRDLALLRVRRLELLRREWSIIAGIVAITGELP